VQAPLQGPAQGLGAPVVEVHEDAVGGEAPADAPADPVAAQQILMREKLEKARLQKQREREAEEREEHARKERLKEKMKALEAAAPAPNTDSKDKTKELGNPARSPQPPKAQVSSPPKPPIPTAEGEVAQYGMMKVHQPHPVKRTNFIESSLMRGGDGQTDRKHAGSTDTNQQRFGQSRLTSMDKGQKFMDGRRPASLEAADASPWRSNALPDSLSGWSSSNVSGASVWTPTQSKDRVLGNGIFDTSGFRIPSGLGAVPGPISGPAHAAGRSAVHGHVTPVNTSPAANAPGTIGPIAPPSLSIAPTLSATSHPLPRTSTKNPALSSRSEDIPLPEPHALHNPPPAQDAATPSNMAISAPSARYDGNNTARFKAEYSISDWQNLPDNLQSENARWMEAAAKRIEHPDASRPQMSTIKHTFRKIAPASHYLDERKVISEETKYLEPDQKDKESFAKALEHGEHSNAPEIVLTVADKTRPVTVEEKPSTPATPQSSTTPVPATTAPTSSSGAQPRSSRFFPRGGPVQSSDKSESPPPPETSSLDSSHETPRVKMPTQVVVKLPPAKPAEQAKAARASTPQSTVRMSKTPSQGSDWQSRINSLLGVSKSDAVRADKPSLNTLSKAPLDEAQARYAVGAMTVSVSLPAPAGPRASGLPTDGSDSPVSKGPDDDVFPQPEFGSTPTILIPRNAAYEGQGQPPAHYRPPHRHTKELERVVGTSRPVFDASDLIDYQKGTVIVTVHLDMKRDGKSFTMVLPSRAYQRGGFAGRFAKRGTNDPFPSRGVRKNSAQFHPRETASVPARGGGGARHRSGRGGGHFQERHRPTAAAADA
jgi:hypothetical protein